MLRSRTHHLLLPLAMLALLVAACSGDDDGNDDHGGDVISTASPADNAGPVDSGSADRTLGPFTPPLEGPGRGDSPGELTDFREEPDWQLPEPENVPEPEAHEDPVLNPPRVAVCPEDWERFVRPLQGFQICYPDGWSIGGSGYVSSPNEVERWYSVGVFNAPGGEAEERLAHVSVYVIPQFSRPFRYTIDCPQPYAVTLAGEPAVACPEFPPAHPEASIASYHVFREDLDYFVNIATYYELNENGEYTDELNEVAAATAIQIAHSFEFIPITRTD